MIAAPIPKDSGLKPGVVRKFEITLSAFEAALSVYSQESYLNDWTSVSSNMATAYLTRGGIDDLRQGIALMERVLKVSTPQQDPKGWALTQMNLGVALSRVPATDPDHPRVRSVHALRQAYELFGALGETARQLGAAYNLGIVMSDLSDPRLAAEACARLEESLQWLVRTGQTDQFDSAIDALADAYMTLLRSRPERAQGVLLCRRAIAVLKDLKNKPSAMQAVFHVGVWLLSNAGNDGDCVDLAKSVFERVLEALPPSEFSEIRAATLANFATVLLVQKSGSRELNLVRARSSLEEALRIFRSLPATAEREQYIGLILQNRMQIDIESGAS
jgi:hypothetical protein